jgi:hypothetical protein
MKHFCTSLMVLAGLLLVAPVQAKNPHDDAGYQGGQSDLPPGLQKKVARGGSLPPGWQRKLQIGEPLEEGLYQRSRPVSDTLKASLPAGPAGTIEVKLEGKVVRLYEATREILDIFELDKSQSGMR